MSRVARISRSLNLFKRFTSGASSCQNTPSLRGQLCVLCPHYLIWCRRELVLRCHLLLKVTICFRIDISEFGWAQLYVSLDSSLLSFELLPSRGGRVRATISDTAARARSMVDRRMIFLTPGREALLPTMSLLPLTSLQIFWLLVQ